MLSIVITFIIILCYTMYSPYTYVIFQLTMAEELPKHVFYKKKALLFRKLTLFWSNLYQAVSWSFLKGDCLIQA